MAVSSEPPVTHSDSSAPTAPATPAPAAVILLVDDDDSVRVALTDVLSASGHQVVAARDGAEALRLFEAHPPDLVLLDLNLPGRDGWRVFDAMERRRPFLPCIVITARRDQVEAATFAGVDVLMEKPLDLAILLQTIAELLREPRQERVSRNCRLDFATRLVTVTR